MLAQWNFVVLGSCISKESMLWSERSSGAIWSWFYFYLEWHKNVILGYKEWLIICMYAFIHCRPASQDVAEISFADDFYGIDEGEDIEVHSMPEEPKRVLTAEEACRMADEEFFLCSKECLVSLSKLHVQQNCRECSNAVTCTVSKHGTSVTFNWVSCVSVSLSFYCFFLSLYFPLTI